MFRQQLPPPAPSRRRSRPSILASDERLQVRIGIHAGKPVENSNDLFGATVQIAARICQDAAPYSIVVSETVRGLVVDTCRLSELGLRRLKGFATPIALYEIIWR
jgi:class 3 adenylate cyclase